MLISSGADIAVVAGEVLAVLAPGWVVAAGVVAAGVVAAGVEGVQATRLKHTITRLSARVIALFIIFITGHSPLILCHGKTKDQNDCAAVFIILLSRYQLIEKQFTRVAQHHLACLCGIRTN